MNLDYLIGALFVRGDTTELHLLSTPYTFSKLKYICLYPIIFQCGASVAENCSALNQHWVFDMNSRAFQMLHINIELAVVFPSNMKRRRNDVLMFCQRRRQ